MVDKNTIIDTYLKLREENNSIPDEVLNFMKKASLEKLERAKLAKYLQCEIKTRYWEDSYLNGIPDEKMEMPCIYKTPNIEDYSWNIIIDLESGEIINWVKGNKAQIHYKSVDNNNFYLLNQKMKKIGKQTDSYVIDTLCPKEDGDGDYVIMDIDENGYIQDFKNLTYLDVWEMP